MNVLSLFDGMSCGQIALNRAGIKYGDYYASEIDPFAIKIAKKNYPKTIHIGDVKNIKAKDLPKIDLLIGGSPCQGFSFAGKQLQFKDERSALFFEYLRLLKETNPRYFLLENVKMKTESENAITDLLGVKPLKINTNKYLPINRDRLYWTNIPFDFIEPEFKNILPKIIKADECVCSVRGIKVRTLKEMQFFGALTRTMFKGVRAVGRPIVAKKTSVNKDIDDLVRNKDYRMLTPQECELLQGVPNNYTEGVSNTQRYMMLGNGWTVDVIAHIFQGLKQ